MLRRIGTLLVFLLALQSTAVEPPPAGETWIAFRADDLRVFSNASPDVARAHAGKLLRVRETIGQITKHKGLRSPTTRVFLFADATSFAPYRIAGQRRGLRSVSAVFLNDGMSSSTVMLHAKTNAADERRNYHLAAHHFFYSIGSTVPLWVDEGLAEYCSTSRIAIGRPVLAHVNWLRRAPLIPLSELFAVTPDSPLYHESEPTGAFYAQSWALVHYLAAGGNERRRAQFSRFLQHTIAGTPSGDAFNASFGIPFAQLEAELREHVRKLIARSATSAPVALTLAEPTQPQPMTRDALYYEFGRLAASMGEDNVRDAAEFLELALKANPRHAGVLAHLGRLHQDAGRNKEAEAAFARAMALGTDDPDVYLVLGRAFLDRYANQEPPQAVLLRARSAFSKAAQLKSDSALAWLGVGMTYVTATDVAPGIAAVRRAQALAPSDKNPPRVLRLLQERQQLNAVNAAIARTDPAEALAKLDQIIPTITNTSLLKIARELRDDLAKRAGRR